MDKTQRHEPKKVTKAVIPAAGFGTRFLPQTKAMPKEMMPLIDKPIIQYVVEELVDAGIKDIIIIGSSNKRAIEDHFDLPSEDLLNNLRAGGEKKKPYIDQIEAIANMANFVYLRQKGPYGNATPIANAAHLIGNEPFLYTWADDFFVSSPSAVKQLIAVHEKYGGAVFACKTAEDDSEYKKYGFVSGEEVSPGVRKMDAIIEKPGKEAAPSSWASVSNYLFTPEIFEYIEKASATHTDGEFMMQPIVDAMIRDGLPYYAREIQNGRYYDTGDKLEYLKTVLDFGLSHEDLGPGLRDYLRSKII